MEGEANLPAPAPSVNTKSINLARSINQESHSSIHSSASSQKSSSSPEFLRNVQAAFKRHRPIGGTLMPRRMVLPQRDMLKSSSGLGPGIRAPNNKLQEAASLSQGCSIGDGKDMVSVRGENHEDASISPPSISGSITNNYDEDYDPFDGQRNEDNGNHSCNGENANMASNAQPQRVPVGEGSKRVQFSMASSVTSQGMPFLFFNHGADAGADDRMATGIDNLSSHMSSLALAEMEWDTGNQAEPSNIVKNEQRHRPHQTIETEGVVRADGASSSFAVRTSAFHDQIQNLRNFLQGDANQPMTQSSVVGSSCATTISVHATSAPVLNSMTKCSSTHVDNTSVEAVGSLACANLTHHNSNEGDGAQQPYSAASIPSNVINNQAMNMVQALSVPANMQVEAEELKQAKAAKGIGSSTDVPPPDKKLNKAKGSAGHAADVLMQAPSSKKVSADMKSKPSKSENPESSRTDKISGAPRKKGYDPDVFFKVNGKFYQRLGKIGSGGSSEVHKVISSDCTIYALKRIKLKGRDYATAYGFCQEILYLNKLKGKSNIIQLIDYEVTDKALLQEVLNGCMNNKDGRVKDDGYIYMVLEYGEIDLAHMLSQKWKEMEDSDAMIDENWLRFYWQQILQAVNTIHEERIVHSDLKPANFLLVKGSLKLIDFGIAKAIMSDTTNIQRDAQVGTLSYMSPEAFMCNERDADGNVIKCGRSSDIWSLGCILYQMVYGRTPFSEYRTFWAKFKVITDPNYEISYEPLANHWLLDLMKKCLAWDRNKRWRIPQLLQHPFLVPPSPSNRLPALEYQTNKAIQLIAESCANNQEASVLCCQLQQLLNEDTTVSKDQQCRLLSQISKICIQLQVNIQRQE